MSKLRQWFLLPVSTLQILLFLVPTLIICAYSVLSRGAYGGVQFPWTIENFQRVLNPTHAVIFWRSLWIASLSTFLCLVLGFPLALFITRARHRRTLLLNLVMLPFWTSFLIRLYAWMFLLRDTGLVNSLLVRAHVIEQPLPLLFNDFAVILGLVYGYLPFMVLPLYATIEKLDPALLDAAGDLGATPLMTLWKVIVPLSRSGIVAGSLLVFIPCFGAYLTPDLLGGGKAVMVGNLVQNQFTAARDWPFGSAMSLVLLVVAFVLLAGSLRRGGEELL